MEGTLKLDNLIRTGDYCTIITNKFQKEGYKKGRRVYVAGHRALPVSESDPYTQRIKFFVHIVGMDGVIDEGLKLFIMDPKSLKKLNGPEVDKLQETNSIFHKAA